MEGERNETKWKKYFQFVFKIISNDHYDSDLFWNVLICRISFHTKKKIYWGFFRHSGYIQIWKFLKINWVMHLHHPKNSLLVVMWCSGYHFQYFIIRKWDLMVVDKIQSTRRPHKLIFRHLNWNYLRHPRKIKLEKLFIITNWKMENDSFL